MDCERDALLRHIRDCPDDDLARLIFADWLQEHFDATDADDQSRLLSWSDYIRSAIRCHDRPLADPFVWEGVPAHLRLEPFAAAELVPAWLRSSLRFVRGFPEGLSVPSHSLELAVEQLADSPLPIRELTVTDGGRLRNDTFDLEGFRRFDSFQYNPDAVSGDRFVRAILHSRHILRVRSLAFRTGIASGGRDGEMSRAIAMSPKFERLEELSVPSSTRRNFDLNPLFRSPSMRRLKVLRIEGRDLNDDEADAMTSSVRMANLETFACGSPSETSLFLRRVGSGALPSLKSLSIAASRSIPGLPSFLASEAIDRFDRLHVDHAGMNPEVWERLPDPTRLGHLEWNCASSRRSEIDRLCRSPFLARCHTLALRGPGVGPSTLRTIASSEHVRELRSLHVADAGPVDAEAFSHFAASATLSSLLTLTLSGPGYGPSALELLSNARFAPSLRSLRIERGTFSSDALLRIFGDPARFPALMDLRLPTPIDSGREAILELTKRFTRVEFS